MDEASAMEVRIPRPVDGAGLWQRGETVAVRLVVDTEDGPVSLIEGGATGGVRLDRDLPMPFYGLKLWVSDPETGAARPLRYAAALGGRAVKLAWAEIRNMSDRAITLPDPTVLLA